MNPAIFLLWVKEDKLYTERWDYIIYNMVDISVKYIMEHNLDSYFCFALLCFD